MCGGDAASHSMISYIWNRSCELQVGRSMARPASAAQSGARVTGHDQPEIVNGFSHPKLSFIVTSRMDNYNRIGATLLFILKRCCALFSFIYYLHY